MLSLAKLLEHMFVEPCDEELRKDATKLAA
jgi:hypothetical protein